jgi:hypothetical protein
MATWFVIKFEGKPTEADFARVAELAAQGYTSGKLTNEPGAERAENAASSYFAEPLMHGAARTAMDAQQRRFRHFTQDQLTTWLRRRGLDVRCTDPATLRAAAGIAVEALRRCQATAGSENPPAWQAEVLFTGDARRTTFYYHEPAELAKGITALRNDLAAGVIAELRVSSPDSKVIFDSTTSSGKQ